MSNVMISFLLAVGASAWIYEKFQKYSGNNTQQSVVATGVAGGIIFFVALVISNMLF